MCIVAATLYLAGHCVELGHTGWYALHLDATPEFNAHRIVNIYGLETEIDSIEYFRQNLQSGIYDGFDRAQRWHSANQTMCTIFGNICGVCISPISHIVGISPIAAEIRLVEYLSLNMQSFNYKRFGRNQGWHRENRLIGAVFGIKFGIERASNRRHIFNINGYTFNWIFRPQCVIPQLQWIWQWPELT
jgi:hypothetical protein